MKYMLQVAPEDCTGCSLCVQVCPAKSKSEVEEESIEHGAQMPIREQEKENWEYFLKLPEVDRSSVRVHISERCRNC